MRRLTDEEMASLVRLSRDGRKGPAKALDALWDLILREAEGVGVEEAAERDPQFRVQDYAIPADQAELLLEAMVSRRRLPARVVAGFHALWAFQSPAEYGERTAPPR
jgi:hypothetical protein